MKQWLFIFAVGMASHALEAADMSQTITVQQAAIQNQARKIENLEKQLASLSTALADAVTRLDGRVDTVQTNLTTETQRANGVEQSLAAGLASKVTQGGADAVRIFIPANNQPGMDYMWVFEQDGNFVKYLCPKSHNLPECRGIKQFGN